jgi:uncharacterized membrane protein YidH (DUF202 family)
MSMAMNKHRKSGLWLVAIGILLFAAALLSVYLNLGVGIEMPTPLRMLTDFSLYLGLGMIIIGVILVVFGGLMTKK